MPVQKVRLRLCLLSLMSIICLTVYQVLLRYMALCWKYFQFALAVWELKKCNEEINTDDYIKIHMVGCWTFKTQAQQTNQISPNFQSFSLKRMHFRKDLGTLPASGTATTGPRPRSLEKLNILCLSPLTPLWAFWEPLPLCRQVSRSWSWRQSGSTGTAGANLQGKWHLFLYCSAQSFWNLSVIWTM